jgi:C4-dicarboxylate transporter DctM subunit
LSALLLFGAFGLFLILQVPIGIAIGLAIFVYMAVFPDVSSLRYFSTSMFSAVDTFPLMAVPFFILAGAVMEGGGLSRRIIDFVKTLVGGFPGGLAIVTIVACAFFGAISGSSPATVAAIGSIMIPYMVAEGYDLKFATAVATCAGTLGAIIPPSIPMVIYSVATRTSVGKLFMGGFGPGILATLLLALTACYISKKKGWRGLNTRFSFRAVWRSFMTAKWALFVPVIILGGIYGGVFTPTEAAAVAVVYGLFVGLFVYRELKISEIHKQLVSSSLMTGAILIIVGTATMLGRILTLEHVPDMLAESLMAFSDSKYVFLAIVGVFLFLVGMVMDTLGALLILAPLLIEVALKFGIDPIHFGLVMVLNLVIGFVTPPVGINLFVAAGMTGLDFLVLSKACIPFICALLVTLALVTYIPAITLWLPNLLGM